MNFLKTDGRSDTDCGTLHASRPALLKGPIIKRYRAPAAPI
jgi:hypothetical protein